MADEESGYAQHSNRQSRDPPPPSCAKKDVKVTANYIITGYHGVSFRLLENKIVGAQDGTSYRQQVNPTNQMMARVSTRRNTRRKARRNRRTIKKRRISRRRERNPRGTVKQRRRDTNNNSQVTTMIVMMIRR